jgi:lipoyl(octanoyl) transferase
MRHVIEGMVLSGIFARNYESMEYIDWGLIPYKEAWDRQLALFNARLEAKELHSMLPDLLIFCEHPPVYTLGKSGAETNLLVNKEDLLNQGVDFFHSDRGGDITFHGPGQIVCYPILDLEHLGLGLKEFIHAIEEAVILFLAEYKIAGEKLSGATGVWVPSPNDSYRKICAIGVRSSRYITMHGLALNIQTDLTYYSKINPCGFTDKGVTSLQLETSGKFEMEACRKLLFNKLHLTLTKKINECYPL